MRFIEMFIKNSSNHDIREFRVIHEWKGYKVDFERRTLLRRASQQSPRLTSGFFNFDWYMVSILYESLGWKKTKLYCNSSSGHMKVIFDVYDDYLNCDYFKILHPDAKRDTGCRRKRLK